MQLGLNQHGRRDGHAQAGGGRFQHVPQMIEFAAGMTRGQLHADAAGPVLPGLGPRAGVQQRRVQHVGRTRQAGGPGWRADRAGGLGQQRRHGPLARPIAAGQDQRVDAPGVQQGGVRRGLQADADVGMRGLETLQPGDEPVGQETGRRAHGQLGRLGAAPERVAAALQQVEGVLGRALQVQAGGGQLDAAGAALEQRAVEPLLQLPDLLADGAVRHAQLLGGQAEAQLAGGAVEEAQRVQEGRRLMIRLLAQLTVMINKSLI